ncbi:MAG: MFS transporter [Chlorobi bacterium]|nr:MFS transporter [Chlorobiota bacterium]MCI0714842.1 MFS transporter [Chlorobiota bacterium]
MHRNIKILLTASILIHSGTNLLAPVFAIYIKDIGGTMIDAGVAVGVYAILKGILYFAFNRLSKDKLSHKAMISGGYFIMFVGYVLYLFAYIPFHVYLIQAVLSIGETIITPSWSSVIAVSLEKGKERHIYSHFYGYRSFFEGLGAIAGGLFAVGFGFNMLFFLMAVLALTSSAISLFLKE